MPCDPDLLDEALRCFPSGLRVTVEPRDPSWFVAPVRAVLERRGAALCLADRPGWRQPDWRTAEWGYVRFHEGRAAPRPCYGRTALATWADRIASAFGPSTTSSCSSTTTPRLRAAGIPPARGRSGRGVRTSRVPGRGETPVGDARDR
jgi:uncharacterized protein YecE (DUF72 family)